MIQQQRKLRDPKGIVVRNSANGFVQLFVGVSVNVVYAAEVKIAVVWWVTAVLVEIAVLPL